MKVLLPIIYIIAFCSILLSACINKDRRLNPIFSSIDSLADEKPDSAAIMLLKFYSEYKNPTQEVEVLYNLLQSRINSLLSNQITSDSMVNAAIDYYEKIRDDYKLAYVYLYKAKINMSSRADSLSIIYAFKAIDKAKATKNYSLSTKIHNHLGTIYLLQNLPKNALHEFKEAYKLTTLFPNIYYHKPLTLRNIARAHSLKRILYPQDNDPGRDSSIIYYNKALSYITNQTPKNISTSIYRELSTEYLFKNNYPKAFEYADASIDSSDMIIHYSSKADIFMRMGKPDSAISYIQRCISDPRLHVKYSFYDKLFQIEKQKGNVWKALEYVDSLLFLSDSMIAQTIPEEMIEIQKKYNEEKMRVERANLEIKYEKEKTHSLRISFIVVVLLSLSTYIYIYNYFKKKKLQQSLLKQKNELLLLNQKIQQWNKQLEINQKKIIHLEQEKKQIESNLYIIAKEKESILKEKDDELLLYRKQESEMSIQKAKYEELCSVEFRKLFLTFPISRKIPAFGIDRVITDKLNIHSQEQLMKIMDEICYNFASRLYSLLQESTDKTCLCCLIRLQVKPKYIMVLCDLSKEAYYKQCQRIAESLVGKSSASALKDYINSF